MSVITAERFLTGIQIHVGMEAINKLIRTGIPSTIIVVMNVALNTKEI